MAYVEILAAVRFLTPTNLSGFPLAQAKNMKHRSNPPGNGFHYVDINILSARVDVHISLRNQIPQNGQRDWCVKRVAKSLSESKLGFIETENLSDPVSLPFRGRPSSP
jgi:hypothetical protein